MLFAAGVAVLALVALAQWRGDHAASPGTLLPLDPAAITRIALGLGREPTEHYVRRDGHWWRTDGTPRRADDGRLGELAELAATPASGWRAASDFDPARIGLAPPVAMLSLDGHTLEYGETAVTGPQRYVRVGKQIALVALGAMPRAPRDQTLPAH